MRFIEIIEASSASKIALAQSKKADAARAYQERLRAIKRTSPAPEVDEKQAAARLAFQKRTSAADAKMRAALANQSEA